MPKNRGLFRTGLLSAVCLLTALFLAACGSRPSRPVIAPQSSPGFPQTLPFAGGSYRVDAAHSEIRLLVYRAGPLARLGHNHVIVNRELAGTALVTSGDLGNASFSLTIPVTGFVVDDAQARSEEGSDYSAEVPDDARSGTLHNMLSADLLDAAQFPVITLESMSTVRNGEALTSTVFLNVAGHRSSVAVPLTVVSVEGRLTATGSVALRQSALGLTPFRAMLGALAVQDEFVVKFRVVAVPI